MKTRPILRCLMLSVAALFGATPASALVVPQGSPFCVQEWYRLRPSLQVLTQEQYDDLLRRAQLNEREAQYRLSKAMRIEGQDKPLSQEDRNKWQERAAANGSLKAQMDALSAKHGGWIDKHPDDGARYVELWEQAAAEGDAEIAYQLALIQLGDRQSETLAFRQKYKLATLSVKKYKYWIEIAAERGHWSAASALCAHHDRGDEELGFPPNPREAFRWCQLAAQYECSANGPGRLSSVLKKGDAVPSENLEMEYWEQEAKNRFDRALRGVFRDRYDFRFNKQEKRK